MTSLHNAGLYFVTVCILSYPNYVLLFWQGTSELPGFCDCFIAEMSSDWHLILAFIKDTVMLLSWRTLQNWTDGTVHYVMVAYLI
jgi:hypothetical protein